jgi:hypothetical protein
VDIRGPAGFAEGDQGVQKRRGLIQELGCAQAYALRSE